MDIEPIALSSILIVEDDPATRARLHDLMTDVAEAGARIDTAADLAQARTCLLTSGYALTLVDMRLPDGNGVDLLGWMHVHAPQVHAVVVSAFAEEETILSALRAGAIGYLLKDREDIELALSLRSLQRGGAPIDPMIARRILTLLPQAPTEAPASDARGTAAHLSAREHEILKLVAQGFSNREIATLLQLSRLTIEAHTRNIYRKLAVGSRTAAVFEARAQGLLE